MRYHPVVLFFVAITVIAVGCASPCKQHCCRPAVRPNCRQACVSPSPKTEAMANPFAAPIGDPDNSGSTPDGPENAPMERKADATGSTAPPEDVLPKNALP